MIAEFGHFALITAFILSLAQSVLPLVGAARRNIAMMLVAPAAAISVTLAVILSSPVFGESIRFVLFAVLHQSFEEPLDLLSRFFAHGFVQESIDLRRNL